MTVIWLEEALDDVLRITRYIAQENPAAARQIGRELVLAGDSLAVFPRRGRQGRLIGTRELTVITPYIIVYEIDEAGTVFILRLWHGAQQREG
jgi:addiction module RelE/StbE family toxin